MCIVHAEQKVQENGWNGNIYNAHGKQDNA